MSGIQSPVCLLHVFYKLLCTLEFYCCAAWGTYWWRPGGIGDLEKEWRETRGRSNRRTKAIYASGNCKGMFCVWGHKGPKRRVESAVQNAIQCYQDKCYLWQVTVQYSLWQVTKSYFLDITGSLFQEGRENWIQLGTKPCAISVRCEWLQLGLCLPLPEILQLYWLCLLSHQELFLPVPWMPASVCQLLYWSPVLFKVLRCITKKVFFIFTLDFYVLFV